MDIMDRKERIKYLQMINRRRLLLEEMQKHINEIELDDFISLDKTKELQTEVYKIMDRLGSAKSSVTNPWMLTMKIGILITFIVFLNTGTKK